MTSSSQNFSICDQLKLVRNRYLWFFIFWKLEELCRFATYLWNDRVNTYWSNYNSCELCIICRPGLSMVDCSLPAIDLYGRISRVRFLLILLLFCNWHYLQPSATHKEEKDKYRNSRQWQYAALDNDIDIIVAFWYLTLHYRICCANRFWKSAIWLLWWVCCTELQASSVHYH